MTSQRPPRWAVRVLESLGADPDFRDAVIGDMDEEFQVRMGYDGERAARRWYVREVWRTFPSRERPDHRIVSNARHSAPVHFC